MSQEINIKIYIQLVYALICVHIHDKSTPTSKQVKD